MATRHLHVGEQLAAINRYLAGAERLQCQRKQQIAPGAEMNCEIHSAWTHMFVHRSNRANRFVRVPIHQFFSLILTPPIHLSL